MNGCHLMAVGRQALLSPELHFLRAPQRNGSRLMAVGLQALLSPELPQGSLEEWLPSDGVGRQTLFSP